jgi:hypothetical protein
MASMYRTRARHREHGEAGDTGRTQGSGPFGVDNLLGLTLSEGKGVTSVGPILPLSSHLSARDLAPNLESFPHFLTVRGGRQAMTARSKVLRNWTIRGEESLGLSW